MVGILDTFGGLRFVVCHRDELEHHRRHDETAIVVPTLRIHQPIAWGAIPGVINCITAAVSDWIAARRYGNEPHTVQAVRMYGLRSLEQRQRTFDINTIVET